jgi:hypothetical protein
MNVSMKVFFGLIFCSFLVDFVKNLIDSVFFFKMKLFNSEIMFPISVIFLAVVVQGCGTNSKKSKSAKDKILRPTLRGNIQKKENKSKKELKLRIKTKGKVWMWLSFLRKEIFLINKYNFISTLNFCIIERIL